MTNPIESCVDSKMSENDRSGTVVDETKVRANTNGNEAEQGHSGNLDEYDILLDIPIALRKGTKFCTKYPICKYVSYDSLSTVQSLHNQPLL